MSCHNAASTRANALVAEHVGAAADRPADADRRRKHRLQHHAAGQPVPVLRPLQQAHEDPVTAAGGHLGALQQLDGCVQAVHTHELGERGPVSARGGPVMHRPAAGGAVAKQGPLAVQAARQARARPVLGLGSARHDKAPAGRRGPRRYW